MMQRRVTHLRTIDEKHEALEKRGIYMLDGEITECEAYHFRLHIMHAAVEGRFKEQPLVVILNSPGGSVNEGLAIYDSLRMLQVADIPIEIVGVGLIASMGTIIMQAGTRRISTPYTQFLVHQVSQTIGFFKSEEASELSERSAELDRLNSIVLDILSKRSGMPLADLKKLCTKKDFWMDAKGAQELGPQGLIDAIQECPQALQGFFQRSS